MPPTPVSTSRPANLSSPRRAKRPESASWSDARTLTAQFCAVLKVSRLSEVFARLHSTSGGFSETELKLLAVKPSGVPSAVRVVMMVTPVANAPSALRNSVGSKAVVSVIQQSCWRRVRRRQLFRSEAVFYGEADIVAILVRTIGEVRLAEICAVGQAQLQGLQAGEVHADAGATLIVSHHRAHAGQERAMAAHAARKGHRNLQIPAVEHVLAVNEPLEAIAPG